MIDPKDITSEGSLLEIYGKFRKNAKERAANRAYYGIPSGLALLYVVIGQQSVSDLAAQVRGLASVGIGLGSSILGFLLAGFTIFATMARPQLIRWMAVTRYPNSDLSYLKQNYFSFLEVFIVYLAFCVMCLTLLIVGQPRDPIATMFRHFDQAWPYSSILVTKATLWALISGYAYIFVRLKVFIFNVFHIVMTGVRWDVEQGEENKDGQGK